jgi:hypothetical protein
LARAVRDDLDWHRSTYCNGGDCIMVAALGEGVVIKGSRGPSDLRLVFSKPEWQRFMSYIKADGLIPVS